MFVAFRAPRAAAYRFHFGNLQQKAFRDQADANAFCERDARFEKHVDGERAFSADSTSTSACDRKRPTSLLWR